MGLIHYYTNHKSTHTRQKYIGWWGLIWAVQWLRYNIRTSTHTPIIIIMVYMAVPVLGQFGVGLGAGSRSSLVSLAATPASSCIERPNQ